MDLKHQLRNIKTIVVIIRSSPPLNRRHLTANDSLAPTRGVEEPSTTSAADAGSRVGDLHSASKMPRIPLRRVTGRRQCWGKWTTSLRAKIILLVGGMTLLAVAPIGGFVGEECLRRGQKRRPDHDPCPGSSRFHPIDARDASTEAQWQQRLNWFFILMMEARPPEYTRIGYIGLRDHLDHRLPKQETRAALCRAFSEIWRLICGQEKEASNSAALPVSTQRSGGSRGGSCRSDGCLDLPAFRTCRVRAAAFAFGLVAMVPIFLARRRRTMTKEALAA
jgi:hypothetical protein